jgi:hypothetical protein
VFFEELQRVVAEARMQGVNLARRGSVGPQLENSRVHFFISFGCAKDQAAKATLGEAIGCTQWILIRKTL